MTLTIEIPDDIADRARIVAASQGQDLDTFAVALISGAATAAADSPPADVLSWILPVLAPAGQGQSAKMLTARLEKCAMNG